ncbi:Flp pilus assembly protein CpaB [Novosphingopyxis sp.]|uniref:Flp pilus assembly protein CpaB n=1 Tax=Novosphingopyxis sp. TaxID=2709690 RepID=UPI003B5CD9DF
MDKRKLILLVGALFVAAIAAFMARSLFMGSAAPETQAAAQPTGPKVLVATRAMPVGTIITADSFRYQPWPAEMVTEAYFVEGAEGGVDISSLPGTVVRHAITAGEPITQGALVSPGDRGFLAAALGPGMRAVTVPVSGLTGVAGFIFPGDRVDLVLTQNVDGVAVENSTNKPLKVSETIIRNLRVLATDQRTEPTVDENGKTIATGYQLVTLEATPRIAEKVTVAQTIGTISLSLRSLADSSADLEEAIASGSIKVPATNDPEEEERVLRSLAQRPIDGKSSYSTGGDVSRFQRRSIPPQTAPEKKEIEKEAEEAKGPVVNVARGNSSTTVTFERR